MITSHRKKLSVAVTLACFVSSLSMAGELLRTPGDALVKEGGKQIAVTVSTLENPDGSLSSKVSRPSGDGIASRTFPQRLDPKAWFVFVESASRVWLFDGKKDLSVLVMSDKNWRGSLADDPTAAEDLKACPQEVRQALPEVVRKSLFR
jgi:hypothetical protein